MVLPDFGCENSAEGEVLFEEGEAGLAEGGGVVREAGGAESGEEAEGEVEEPNESVGGEAERAGWDAEVGEEPEGAGCEVGDETGGELIELRLGEAIEKEVGDDEVVEAVGLEGDGVGRVGLEARFGGGGGGAGSMAEEVEHGGTEIDGVGVKAWIAGEEVGEEAAVAVAKDEDAAGVQEPGEEVEAATFERSAEGEVFEPVIGASDVVEVRLWFCVHVFGGKAFSF